MCKNNLGCATDPDCGCGCKDCNGDKQSPTRESPLVPDFLKPMVTPSGYAKPSPADYMTESLPSGSSGYSKKNVIEPSGYNKKEIVKIYPPKEIVVVTASRQKPIRDNIGIYVAGGLLILFGLLSGNDDHKGK